MKKRIAIFSAIAILSSFSVGIASAATNTATAGGICTKPGATTKISGKSFTCLKALSGKLVWATTPSISGGISGGLGDGPDGGAGDDHGAHDAGLQAAFKKYNSCLVSHGGVAITPPAHGPGGAPAPQASATGAQAKALAACAALAPKFHPRDGH